MSNDITQRYEDRITPIKVDRAFAYISSRNALPMDAIITVMLPNGWVVPAKVYKTEHLGRDYGALVSVGAKA